MNFENRLIYGELKAFIEKKIRETARLFYFKEIDLPHFVDVSKNDFLQMKSKDYDQKFSSNRVKSKILRPEGTLITLNNFVHSTKSFEKVFYIGEMFDLEKESSFFQIGAEIIGGTSNISEIILLLFGLNFFKNVGFNGIKIEIGNTGCKRCKQKYYEKRTEYLQENLYLFCSDCQPKILNDPTHIFYCTNNHCLPIVNQFIEDQPYCKDCKFNLDTFEKVLINLAIPYKKIPFLSHGFNFYNEIIFHFCIEIDGEKKVLGSGGRYNNLLNNTKKKDRNASGFSINVQTLLDIMKNKYYIPSFFDVALGFQSLTSEIHVLQIYEEIVAKKIPIELYEKATNEFSFIKYAKDKQFKLAVYLNSIDTLRGECKIFDLFRDEVKIIKIQDLLEEVLRHQKMSVF